MDTDLGNDQAAVKVTKVAKLGPVSEEAMVTDSGDTNQTSISSLRAQQVLKVGLQARCEPKNDTLSGTAET